MSFIQLSSSLYVKDGQSSISGQENLGNFGDEFTNRFNSVFTIPPNAEIALCQAIFQMDTGLNQIHSESVATDDRLVPALGLLFGANNPDATTNYYDNLKITDNQQNKSPTDVPMVLYAPRGTYKILTFWETVLKRLNLSATPTVQDTFQVSTVATTNGQITVNFHSEHNRTLYNTTGTPPNQIANPYLVTTTILNNKQFPQYMTKRFKPTGQPAPDPDSLEMFAVSVGDDITAFEYSVLGGAKAKEKWWQKIAFAMTSNNGIANTNGWCEMDQFLAQRESNGLGRLNISVTGIPAASRYDVSSAKRFYAWGINRWESKYITGNYQKLEQIGSEFSDNPFHVEAWKHAQNFYSAWQNGTVNAATDIELASYAYGLSLMSNQNSLPFGASSDYFFAVVPMISRNQTLPVKDLKQIKYDQVPEPVRKGMGRQCLVLCGIERGKRILYTDQGNRGANEDQPRSWTAGLEEYPMRLVVMATGDRMAQCMFNCPYSGFLDPYNIPIAGDAADVRNRRFMSCGAFTEPNPFSQYVENTGHFILMNERTRVDSQGNTIGDPFPENTCLRGLRIVNQGEKIQFRRLYYNGTADANKENSIEVTATRKLPTAPFVTDETWIKEWAEQTDDALIKPVLGFINHAIYPLQTKYVIGGLRYDQIFAPKIVEPKQSQQSQSNCLDLVSNGANNGGSLDETRLQMYETRGMIVPNCIWNRDFYNNVTPIINYFPITATNDDASPLEFVSTNRKPTHSSLVESAGIGRTTNYGVQATPVIIVGDEEIFRVKDVLYSNQDRNERVNPFLTPNISQTVGFPMSSELKAIPFVVADAATYLDSSGSYNATNVETNPIGLGIYVHLLDLPNMSVFGSMSQTMTRLVACINKYDSLSYIDSDNDGSYSTQALCWNAYTPLYIKLNNPAPIELSELSIRLTDRFYNRIKSITNTQLVFYMISGDEKVKMNIPISRMP